MWNEANFTIIFETTTTSISRNPVQSLFVANNNNVHRNIEEMKLFPINNINVEQNYKLFDLKTNSVITQILHEFEGNFTKL